MAGGVGACCIVMRDSPAAASHVAWPPAPRVAHDARKKTSIYPNSLLLRAQPDEHTPFPLRPRVHPAAQLPATAVSDCTPAAAAGYRAALTLVPPVLRADRPSRPRRSHSQVPAFDRPELFLQHVAQVGMGGHRHGAAARRFLLPLATPGSCRVPCRARCLGAASLRVRSLAGMRPPANPPLTAGPRQAQEGRHG